MHLLGLMQQWFTSSWRQKPTVWSDSLLPRQELHPYKVKRSLDWSYCLHSSSRNLSPPCTPVYSTTWHRWTSDATLILRLLSTGSVARTRSGNPSSRTEWRRYDVTYTQTFGIIALGSLIRPTYLQEASQWQNWLPVSCGTVAQSGFIWMHLFTPWSNLYPCQSRAPKSWNPPTIHSIICWLLIRSLPLEIWCIVKTSATSSGFSESQHVSFKQWIDSKPRGVQTRVLQVRPRDCCCRATLDLPRSEGFGSTRGSQHTEESVGFISWWEWLVEMWWPIAECGDPILDKTPDSATLKTSLYCPSGMKCSFTCVS